MGSFPNMVAGQLLKAIFVTPFSSGAVATASGTVCSLYNSDTTTTLAAGGGFLGTSTAGAQLLYLGLITHPGAVGGQTVLTMADVNITSNTNTLAGTAWVPTGGGGTSGASIELIDSGYTRQAFTATLANTADGGTLAAVTLPVAQVNFGTIAVAVTGAAVGFFISSVLTKNTGAALRPHVIAYGQLSTAKALGVGDQPTFAANAITITLD